MWSIPSAPHSNSPERMPPPDGWCGVTRRAAMPRCGRVIWPDDLAPELTLLGAAAAAPAANLLPIMRAQWPTTIGWVIGPEVAVSWPAAYPGTPLEGVLSDAGLDSYEKLAAECAKAAGLEGLVRGQFGQTFFETDPSQQPQWRAITRGADGAGAAGRHAGLRGPGHG